MSYDDLLTKINFLIGRLNDIIDILHQSTKEIIDTGNVNYQLKNIIDKLDSIIDTMDESVEKEMLENVKYDVTSATEDLMDNTDIFHKINRLKSAQNVLIDIRSKLDES